MRSDFDGFGRVRPATRAAITGPLTVEALRAAAPGAFLPFGNGRSYGDTCHNDTGTLADMRGSARIIAFNPDSGVLEAEAGVMLHRIIDYCAPYGFFLPVTPGTRFVTLGGAVANDVHGKNHHVRGTLGRHIEQIELVRSDGTHTLSRNANPALFGATIGGMGLTGIITRVRLKMMKVGSLNVVERLQPFATLDAYFEQADAADAANEYAVAWLDQLHGERGVLMTANHADDGDYRTAVHAPRLSVPFELPMSALNHLSLRAFNAAFNFAKARKAGRDRVTGFAGFFYPLDAVGNWNRLYGPAGLFQHQSAIPFEAAREAIPAMLAASRKAGQASFLTVLKRFGDIASPGLMSFPVPGYTLTLDFPNRGAKTLALLDDLDRITVEAGGRVNPYKDARMGAQTFSASFPYWGQLEALRDPALCSDFWRRTALALSKNGNGSIATNDLQQNLTKVS